MGMWGIERVDCCGLCGAVCRIRDLVDQLRVCNTSHAALLFDSLSKHRHLHCQVGQTHFVVNS